LTIANTTLDYNSATFGGGIGNEGTATVSNCSFDNDTASNSGGGFYNFLVGMATLTGCDFNNNSAVYGGGSFNHAGTATTTVLDCTFAGNSASNNGGGIYNDASVKVANSTIAKNSAGLGGGMSDIGNSSRALLTNCTVADNSADIGGGIYNEGVVTANITIVAVNLATSFARDFYGAFDPASSFNLIGDGSFLTGIIDGPQGNQVGTFANPIDPLLAPLQTNGGTLMTLALLPGSRAIDAGSNALAVDANSNPLITDERDVARIVNGFVDIGAFESRNFTIAVSSGNGQRTTVTTRFLNPLVVTVTSPYGDPVAGGMVAFAAPSSGPGATFSFGGSNLASKTIDPAGQAATAVIANTVAGDYAVEAVARGASFPAGFSLTNTPYVASSFVVSGYPSSTTAGVVHTVVVTAKDQFGNIATGYTGIVHFTSTDPQAVLPLDSMLTNGIGLFSVALKTAGIQSITATDAAFASITGSESGITVNPSVAARLVITGPSTFFIGIPTSFTVTAYDAYGNVATGCNDTLRISSTDAKAGLPSGKLTNGTGTFTATFRTKGLRTLTVTDPLLALTDSLVINVLQPNKK
jgi:predicted outer membrane repeat protein